MTKQNVLHLTIDDMDKYIHSGITWTKTVSESGRLLASVTIAMPVIFLRELLILNW